MKSVRARLIPLMTAWVFLSLAVSVVSTLGQQQSSDSRAAVKRESEIAAAVKFAETVLEHGRDTYGEERTPLFVDALNVDTMKPPARIPSWGGEGMQPWISSNLADQGNLMRFDERNRAGIQSGSQLSFYDTAADMILAAGMLYRLTGNEKPLVWAERLLGSRKSTISSNSDFGYKSASVSRRNGMRRLSCRMHWFARNPSVAWNNGKTSSTLFCHNSTKIKNA
jgi:hypothetical protein